MNGGCGFCQEFKKWWSAPFMGAEHMSGTEWFLFIGLMLAVFASWHMIFRHIRGFE